ncbi:MAG: S8 family serine peptidase, partial [Deltaproteobacteria bacterium]|nr:S8 family serine peptidase [Deltaproteobacteria bacterium]
DWDKDFASEDDFVIGGADWFAYMPDDYVNGDGWNNVWGSGNVSDWYRPANNELSFFETPQFITELAAELNIDLADKVETEINSYFFNPFLADITNSYLNAFNYINIDPLVLDLNGDGVQLISYENSKVVFDVDNDNYAERTGWVSAQDGILVHDKNEDGVINDITETISEYYVANAADGLEALKTLDFNEDNIFDKNDTMWEVLRVWQDINSDGITDENELKTLDTLGIKSINLSREVADRERIEGNPVLSRSTMTLNNGRTREVAAVDFKTNPIGYEWNNIDLGRVATSENEASTLVLKNSAYVEMSKLNNITTVYGSAGQDEIIGTDNDDWIFGGAGSDKLSGGAGNDLIIIDAEDLQQNIDGGEGRDILLITSAAGVYFNLTVSNIEVATGGAGADILIGGGAKNAFIDGAAGDDLIIGGLADDALAGGDGADKIDGAYGDDILRGHRGNDNLDGGKGDDYIDGGLDNDILNGNKGNDILIGGAGDDIIDGGDGFDIAKYKGSYADYDIIKQGEIFEVIDLKTGDTDQLKNIERVRFDDVTIWTEADKQTFLPVSDIIEIESGSESLFISAEQLLANDKKINIEESQLKLFEATNAIGGTVELTTENGKTTGVIFTPDPSYIGVMIFDYSITNDANQIINVTQRYNDGTYVKAPIKAAVQLRADDDPDDPLYYDQWYLQEIRVKKVWEDYTGKGVKIGIFEDGDINHTHTDLDNNLSAEYKKNLIFKETENFEYHTTMVAGIIAAEKNGEGSIGVAYNSEIEGWSWTPYEEDGLYQIQNVDIANNSWGFDIPFQDNFNKEYYSDYQTVLGYGALYGRDGLGTIVIFSAGNQREAGDNVTYHNITSFRSVIAVGSINQEGDIGKLIQASTPFSTPGSSILVSAPGSNINTTSNLLQNQNGSTFQSDFETIQGTSFSAPIVSGIAALMLEASPWLGYRDVQHILAYSAKSFQDDNTQWKFNGAGDWNGGGLRFSQDYGFGIVDAHAAVRLAETWNQINIADNEYYIDIDKKANIAIQDNKTITDTIQINNDAINTEHIEVTLDITHQRIGDLIISLISPGGTESILLNRPGKAPGSGNTDIGLETENLNFTFTTTNLWGENSYGNWTMKITDAATGKTGTLNQWALSLYGKYESGNDTYIYTNEFTNLSENNRQILIDNNGGTDTINTAAIIEDVIINLNPGTTSKIAGKNLTIDQSSVIEYLFTGDGNDTLIGNNADNILSGERGSNTYTGGYGNDKFVIRKQAEATNTITDFHTQKLTSVIEYLEQASSVNDAVSAFINQTKTGGQQDKIFMSYFEDTELIDLNITEQNGDLIINFADNQKLVLKNIDKQTFIKSDPFDKNNIISGDGNTGAEEIINGGIGDDIIFGNKTGYYTIYGEEGDDVLQGGNQDNFGNDKLYGGKGNDILLSANGNDILDGGEGDDLLLGNTTRNVLLIGGAGTDKFMIKNTGSGTSTITDFDVSAETIDITGFQNIKDLSDLDITLYNNTTIINLTNTEQKLFINGILPSQLSPNNFINLTNNNNTTFTDTIIIETSPYSAKYPRSYIQPLNIQGDDQDNTINGAVTADTLNGGAGNDAIYGEDGNDTINGETGADLIQAGAGDDTIKYSADSQAQDGWFAWNVGSPNNIINGESIPVKPRFETYDVIDGGQGFDTIEMTDESEALFLDDQYSPAYQEGPRITNIETIKAGAGNDIIDLT